MVDNQSIFTQTVVNFPKPPTRMSVGKFFYGLLDCLIGFLQRLIALHPARELNNTTGLTFTQPLINEFKTNQSLIGRPHYFFGNTSLMAWFSKLKSAYICFKPRFSSSNSFSRVNSDTCIPPYLDFQT